MLIIFQRQSKAMWDRCLTKKMRER
ncbi:hypothetical protein Godav_011988 [Gossypium davidsonii]|uniref:Uncharacterized protein n=1 Tax=Gossypium davidsonii TaxID=34287 RepID=A0A7J8RBS2_GOSDV|nr:hypothetical protein [Gossypium davidsonii]